MDGNGNAQAGRQNPQAGVNPPLTRMDPTWPGPDFDVEEQRRRLAEETPPG